MAYESAARERAARKKSKLRWHRAPGGGLTAQGERGEYCITRQRPDRRHGLYRYGVTHGGHSIGSTESLAAGKGLATHHEFKQSCAEGAVEEARKKQVRVPSGGWKFPGSPVDAPSSAPKSKQSNDADTAHLFFGRPRWQLVDQGGPEYADGYEVGFKDGWLGLSKTPAGSSDSPFGHGYVLGYADAEKKKREGYSVSESNASGATEERRGSYRSELVKNLRLMGQPEPEAFADAHATDVERYEVAGVAPNIAAAILLTSLEHRQHREFYHGDVAEEAPTRGEWEIVVSHPPSEHRGRILSMAGPGYGESRAGKIYLYGFYDDEETRRVANSISRMYGGKYGTTVTYGPRRSMAAEDSHPGVIAEERRRPGAHRQEKEEDCEHGCPTGECKPFTKLERDVDRFEQCMALAAKIGPIDNSRKIYDLIHRDIERRDREVFVVVCLDFRGQVRGQIKKYVELAVGQRHRVAVDIEDILQIVLLSGCDGFCVGHSHPSGHAEPSEADKKLTKDIEKAAAIACPNVKMVDHIVVGLGQYYSFADRKLHKVR